MEAPSHNHANYQARLDYIQRLLGDNYRLSDKVSTPLHRTIPKLSGTKITPVQYEAHFPFEYNNFVYRLSIPVDIPTTPRNADVKLQQPGCVPQETHVQNEVAILTLASAALQHIEPSIVPRVFGLGPASPGRLGWILQELMPGVPLDDVFSPAGSLKQKKEILGQMARILKGLQDYQLPPSIQGWGGLTFDDGGAIISASMPTVGAGPWSSLQESYRGRIKVALGKAEENPYLQGWLPNAVRERVEDFIERGLPKQFADLSSSQDRAIIHADFTEFPLHHHKEEIQSSDNLLYEPETGRLTALLDYDFSGILRPAYEFFRSFAPDGGRFTGWISDRDPEGNELIALRMAKLSGEFPSPLPTSVVTPNGPGKHNVKRPSTIQGIDKLANVDALLGTLTPWRLINKDFLRMNPDEGHRMELRRMGEEQLIAVLERIGF
ncbi:hypothetical protein B0H66DRAFT_583822 [Apodospora peruviana]|uniref:Aminoglycoside phosphotransferase domain-containing protein n=1 Tax=Apodospora peruviana TaxID=516989 RepID=A0AAE0M1A7_9PEZI|nr:hypothetical protein B0H66DRAFT_583822 [Apodospora peruviana]